MSFCIWLFCGLVLWHVHAFQSCTHSSIPVLPAQLEGGMSKGSAIHAPAAQ